MPCKKNGIPYDESLVVVNKLRSEDGVAAAQYHV